MARAVLVGLPGAGKSTLARALGEDFVDTDDVFGELEGEPVPDFLRRHGETLFRERELRALATALARATVVATGGGVVTTSPAREVLQREFTIWLTCPDDALLLRMGDGDRPLLGARPRERLARLRSEREGWYSQVSKAQVDADRAIEDVVAELVRVVSRDRIGQ